MIQEAKRRGDKPLRHKPISRRDLESEKKKRQIYRKAMELFSEYGYKNTTMKDISEETGISIGSIYHHYRNKEAILFELSEHMGEAETFAEDLDEKAKAPYEALYRFLIAYFGDWATLGVELSKTLYLIFDQAYLYADNTYRKPRGFRQLESFIALAQQQGTFDTTISAEEAAHFLLTFSRGILFEWTLYKGSFSIVKRAEEYLPRLLKTFMITA
jgi:AcrR family transcriptional regulator